MSQNNQNQMENAQNKKPYKTILISLGIIAVAVVVAIAIFFTEPEAEREGATKQTAMLVEVTRVDSGNFNPLIITTGTVVPVKDIVLSSRVSGEIVNKNDRFIPGGFVEKGSMLLQIDPADYKNALEMRKSELLQAQAALDLEMGKQFVAQQDYELVRDSTQMHNKSLILRKPQLKSAEASVKSAQAAVERAKLDLQRTTIKAPFNAQIIERNVNLGSQVAPGNNLGRLVGIEYYWIEATVPLAQLNWLSFEQNPGDSVSQVIIKNRNGWTGDQQRVGYLDKRIGALEDKTRLARVLVKVDDPLALNKSVQNKPALIIGSFLELQIKGKQIKNVIRINRDYLRKGETVWVMQNEELHIRKVDIVFRDAKYAYVSSGIKAKDSIVTTNLSTVVDGEALRVKK